MNQPNHEDLSKRDFDDIFDLTSFDVAEGTLLSQSQRNRIDQIIAGMFLSLDSIDDPITLKAIYAASALRRDNHVLSALLHEAVNQGFTAEGIVPENAATVDHDEMS